MDANTITSLINLGAAGAVIIVVYYFLRFIRERDKDWRDFFTGIRQTDGLALEKLTAAIDKISARMESLENKFDSHDATEMEFLRGVVAKLEPKTQPRRRTGD